MGHLIQPRDVLVRDLIIADCRSWKVITILTRLHLRDRAEKPNPGQGAGGYVVSFDWAAADAHDLWILSQWARQMALSVPHMIRAALDASQGPPPKEFDPACLQSLIEFWIAAQALHQDVMPWIADYEPAGDLSN